MRVRERMDFCYPWEVHRQALVSQCPACHCFKWILMRQPIHENSWVSGRPRWSSADGLHTWLHWKPPGRPREWPRRVPSQLRLSLQAPKIRLPLIGDCGRKLWPRPRPAQCGQPILTAERKIIYVLNLFYEEDEGHNTLSAHSRDVEVPCTLLLLLVRSQVASVVLWRVTLFGRHCRLSLLANARSQSSLTSGPFSLRDPTDSQTCWVKTKVSNTQTVCG